MSAPVLSVVIPCLDEAERLPRTLARVAAEGEGCEVVVVDGGSRDGTAELAAAHPGVRLVRAPPSRGGQLNAGAAAARGETLFFLHADTLPPPGFPGRIASALALPGVVAGSFRLAFDSGSPVLRFYGWCSRFNRTLFTYGDQGLFLRRADFEAIGSYAPHPLFEDVEIQERLRRRGRFVKLPVPVVTSARRFEAGGALRRQALNALLILAYRCGASPEALARRYHQAARSQKTGKEIGSSKRVRQDSGVSRRSSRW